MNKKEFELDMKLPPVYVNYGFVQFRYWSIFWTKNNIINNNKE